MKLSTNGNIIEISGNIKSISDFQTIKSNVDLVLKSSQGVTINIIDSLSITSSVIGYFNKLVLKDGVSLKLNVGNDQLIELLKDLNLDSTFNAAKI